MQEEKEIWTDVLGYEGIYQISSFCRLRSIDRYVKGGHGDGLKFTKGQYLKPSEGNHGYLRYSLSKDNRVSIKYAHRLVFEAFNGPVPKGMEVNHINEIKTDNRLSNLNLMSHKDNTNYGTAQSRRTEKRSLKVRQLTLDGEFVAEYPSANEAGRQVSGSVSAGTRVSDCARGKKGHKTYKGFKWEYV